MESSRNTNREAAGEDEPREENNDSQSNFSRRSGIRGPYHQSSEDRHFPIYAPVLHPTGVPHRYSRPQLSTGNGFAPFKPVGCEFLKPHFMQGVSIGDVGYFNSRGVFNYCFNIFCPRDDPIQLKDLPRNFTPIQPPLSEWEITTILKHFPPGSVVVTEGLECTRTCESPMKLDFTTCMREAAVMILPSGATREDLVDTSRLHAYIKEHAADWYQHRNQYSRADGNLPVSPGMNGTLYLITGRDRAKSWANASLPVNASKEDPPLRFSYDASSEKDRFTHQFTQDYLNWEFCDESTSPGQTYAVFLRGVTIALGTSSWKRHIPEIPPRQVPGYSLHRLPLHLPTTRLGRLYRALQYLKSEYQPTSQRIFHPSTFLLQVLVNMAPEADIALVEDCVWCSVIGKESLTHQTFVGLAHRVAETYDAAINSGVATFVPRPRTAGLPLLRRVSAMASRLVSTRKIVSTMDTLLSDRPKATKAKDG